uniref:Inner membrane protein n=1 Tax=Elaeophora elaphi TaxID=1147741 RepID=A0A0R3RFQ7_9BILA
MEIILPVQVIALVCLLIAFILLILCLSTTWWLRSGGFRTGLWLECTASDQTQSTIAGGPPPGRCQKIHRHAEKRLALGLAGDELHLLGENIATSTIIFHENARSISGMDGRDDIIPIGKCREMFLPLQYMCNDMGANVGGFFPWEEYEEH